MYKLDYRNLSMNPPSHTGVFSNYIFGQTCDNHVVRVVRFGESNKSIQILSWSTQWRKQVFWDQKHVQHAITVIAVELTLSPVLSCRRRIPNAMYFEPISWLMLILLSLPRNLTHLYNPVSYTDQETVCRVCSVWLIRNEILLCTMYCSEW